MSPQRRGAAIRLEDSSSRNRKLVSIFILALQSTCHRLRIGLTSSAT